MNATRKAARGDGHRTEAILEALRAHITVTISELAARLRVSEMTIRRDIHRLVETGHAIRVPGGARLANSVAFEKTFAERLQKMAEAKNRISRAAAALVKEGEAVVLDSGTTTLCIARYLRTHRNIVVITSSITAFGELRGATSVRLELTGGVYRSSSDDLVGGRVEDALARVHANKLFFGAAAVSFEKGVMNFDPDTPRALLQAATERILVVDSSKIGSEALYVFCGLKECNLVITDNGIKPEHLIRLRKLVPVLVAD